MLLFAAVSAVVVVISTATTEINNMDDFVKWAKKFGHTPNSVVVDDVLLLCDLWFNDTTSNNIPLGDSMKTSFSGVFDGGGHTIFDLRKTSKAIVGLFYELADATVKNVVFDESCSFGSGGTAGAVCVAAEGDVVIDNVTNNAHVSGNNMVGGLIGEVRNPKISRKSRMSISNSINNGNVECSGESCYVGGLIG